VVSPRQIVEDGVFSVLNIQLRIQASNRLRLKAEKVGIHKWIPALKVKRL